MDHQDLRRAHSSGHESHYVCHKCGWPFPNPHPSARHRRAHKKICGTVEGYKVAGAEGSAQLSVSDDEQHSDEDPKTPGPKVLERSVYERGSGVIGQGSIKSDDGVFSDAVQEFSDSGSAAWTGEGLEDAPGSAPNVERGTKSDLNAIPFHSDGGTTEDKSNPNKYETVTDASEDMKKTDVTDSMIESCLTSVDQEAEVTGITATNLDRNISSETTSISDGRTEESKLLLGDSNGLHPIKYEMVTDASEAIKKTGATDSMIESCLTSVDQDAEVTGITATNLDRNMILPNKVAGETVEGGSKLEGSNEMTSEYVRDDELVPSEKEHTDGFDMHIPQIDVPPEVESVAHVNTFVDTAEKKVDNTDGIQYLSPDKVIESRNGKEEENANANVHVLSVPDDIHVVDDPVLMLEDFRNHKVKQLDQVTFLDSLEQFDDKENDVKQPVFNESLNIFQSSHLSGGTVVSSDMHDLEASLEPDLGSSKPMIKSVPVEDEANMSETEIKMFKNQSSDEIGAPADAVRPQIAKTYMVGLPEGQESYDKSNESLQVNFAASGAGIDQTTHSVGPENNEKDGNCDGTGESGDHSRKVTAEENLVANPVATVQSAEGQESYEKSNESGQESHNLMRNCDGSGESGDHSRKVTAEENLVANPIATVQSAEGQVSYEKSNESLQVNFAAGDAGIDQTTHSVGPDDNEKDGSCDGSGESGDYSRKGPAEVNLVATPIATVQSADHYENQIYPAANLHKVNDASEYEKGVIEKCNKIGDAGYNENAETSNLCGDDKSRGVAENFSTDPASNLESVSCLSELQVNPVTNLHESGDAAGDCEKDKTEKCDITGYDGDHEKAEKYASSGEEISKRSTEKTFAEDSTTNLESIITLSDSQVHPSGKLPDVDGSADRDEGEIEKFVISGNESMEGSVEENILVKSELTPESSANLTGSKAIVEDAANGSRMELVETSGRDLDSGSNSSKVAGKILSDAQQDVLENEIACNDKILKEVDAGVAAESDHGQNVESFQKSSEDHGKKEPGFSALDTESSVQSFIASEDSGSQEVHAVASGITSQSLLEEGDNNLVRQQPSATAIDVDSNSQTDSLEANWGSFSVLSMQSDAETVPHTHSQSSLGENSGKSDMFEAPSFMTLVEPRGGDDQKATGSEILTAVQNPEQPKPASLQTGWFPSMTHVVNESPGRKKNEEIIAKVTNRSTGKQHTPLKNLLGEASSESNGKPLNQKESLALAPQKDDKAAMVSGPVTTTVSSILNPESPTGQAAKKETAKEWNSPARYPSDTKSEKRKVKGRSWAQFVCCASVN
ncbi:uncharacterized protein LOC133707901 [Rosa rugosa]|uniref:uncharacterized protein LOC133707901 n=1 Tax=Rosa rugosa TaxID=74645 RepID=UPI002B417190|nr:uncharacterized protein LOC133707901 [Rosa rugosa]